MKAVAIEGVEKKGKILLTNPLECDRIKIRHGCGAGLWKLDSVKGLKKKFLSKKNLSNQTDKYKPVQKSKQELREKLNKLNFIESLILAQDERWRRA